MSPILQPISYILSRFQMKAHIWSQNPGNWALRPEVRAESLKALSPGSNKQLPDFWLPKKKKRWNQNDVKIRKVFNSWEAPQKSVACHSMQASMNHINWMLWSFPSQSLIVCLRNWESFTVATESYGHWKPRLPSSLSRNSTHLAYDLTSWWAKSRWGVKPSAHWSWAGLPGWASHKQLLKPATQERRLRWQ